MVLIDLMEDYSDNEVVCFGMTTQTGNSVKIGSFDETKKLNDYK